MHQILDAQLVIAALQMALTQRRPVNLSSSTPIAVAQFASAAYRQVLAQHRLLASMSRKGNCYDNAFIESFWSTLKYELVYHHRFATLAQARTAIFDYIETFYNRTRLHSSLDYQSPINFESKLNLVARWFKHWIQPDCGKISAVNFLCDAGCDKLAKLLTDRQSRR